MPLSPQLFAWCHFLVLQWGEVQAEHSRDEHLKLLMELRLVGQSVWQKGVQKRCTKIRMYKKSCVWVFLSLLLLLFSCPVMSDSLRPMDSSMLGFPVPHHLPKFAKVRVHCIGDTIQPNTKDLRIFRVRPHRPGHTGFHSTGKCRSFY